MSGKDAAADGPVAHNTKPVQACADEQHEPSDNGARAETATSKQGDRRPVAPVTAPSGVLDDGRIVELAINPDFAHIDYIVWDAASATAQRMPEVSDNSSRYLPPKAADKICTTSFAKRSGAVLLPTEPLDYGTEKQLAEDIRAFIHRYVELDERYETIATYYVMFTWLFDRFDEVPYLRFFTHDIGCGKSRALETIGSLCYRPIFLGGSSSSSALRRMVDTYRGTVVADEQDRHGKQDLTSDYVKILNQGFQRGRPVIICTASGEDWEPEQFDVFGPKVVVTRTKFGDDALESRFFTIPMRPRTRNDLPLNLPREQFDAQALVLRNKLLKYRFDRYHSAGIQSRLRIEKITDRLNQVGIPLLSTITSEEARGRVVDALREADAELIEYRADSIEADIVDYLAEAWADGDRVVTVGEIATHLNASLMSGSIVSIDWQRSSISAKKVGQLVRERLGLKTQRTKNGYVVGRNEQRLGQLRKKYGVRG